MLQLVSEDEQAGLSGRTPLKTGFLVTWLISLRLQLWLLTFEVQITRS